MIKRRPLTHVSSGCLNCGSKPIKAPMDMMPHPGFGGIELTCDGQVPGFWREFCSWPTKEIWWGTWESGEVTAGARKGEKWYAWIGGVEYPHLEEDITFQDIEDAVLLDPNHDWQLRIDAPLYNVTYQRQGEAEWIAIHRGLGFA